MSIDPGDLRRVAAERAAADAARAAADAASADTETAEALELAARAAAPDDALEMGVTRAETGLDAELSPADEELEPGLDTSVTSPGFTTPTSSELFISTLGIHIDVKTDKNGRALISVPSTNNLGRSEKIELGMNIAAIAIAKGACDTSTNPPTFTVKIKDWQVRAAVVASLEMSGFKVKTPGVDKNREASQYNKNYGLPSMNQTQITGALFGTYDRYSQEIQHIKNKVQQQSAKCAPGYERALTSGNKELFIKDPLNGAKGFVQRFYNGGGDEHQNYLRRSVVDKVFRPNSDDALRRAEQRSEEYGSKQYLAAGETISQKVTTNATRGLIRANGGTHDDINVAAMTSVPLLQKELLRVVTPSSPAPTQATEQRPSSTGPRSS